MKRNGSPSANQKIAENGGAFLDAQPLFFPVSVFKFLVMSTFTLGFYDIYWFYQNWKMYKARTQKDVSPIWRAIFGFFFCPALFERIREEAEPRGVATAVPSIILWGIWLVLRLIGKTPEPFCFLEILAPLIFVPIQLSVNKLNRIVAPKHDPNSQFDGLSFIVLLFGCLLCLFLVLRLYAPIEQ